MATKNASLLALLCLALLCGAALVEAVDQARCGKNIRKGYTLYGSTGEIKTIRWAKGSSHKPVECCKLCKRNSRCKRWLFYADKFGNTGCTLYTAKAKKVSKSYSSTIGEV